MFIDKKLAPLMRIDAVDGAQEVSVTGQNMDYLAGYLLSPVFNATHVDVDHYTIEITPEKTLESVNADLKELADEWGWKIVRGSAPFSSQ